MRTRATLLRALPLACTAALLLTAQAVAAGPAEGVRGDAAASRTGDRGARLYAPDANPGAYSQALDLVRHGKVRDAAGIVAMARTPHAVWFGDQSPAVVEKEAKRVAGEAARQQAVPVFALYNVPGRDCANYSGGGASTTAEYRAWIDAVARGIGNRDALVVLEPDSLALLPADCGQDDAEGTKTAARYTEVNYAVDTLEPLARTKVYLDTGHQGWHSVNSIVPRLLEGGVERATGFYTNASNYHTEDANTWYGTLISSCLAYVDKGGDSADCPNQYWPRTDAQAWLDAHVDTDPARMKHFVTDSSRNGRGTWTAPADKYTDPQEWCNPPGRGLGARPTTRTGDPLHDARLWIKIPGESDGLCLRGTEGPEDPERGTVDPAAGAWFPQQALELVKLAEPPLF
ncbi:endoglucanase [Streptomyces sp. LamerLS-316]|uniref:glycoside hydrolase family 6 protein n=1 Tax=unclassified Streptomyces TaxID=2593676 RepID=UPI000823808E|nr:MULTISPECIES: glycoside hydrolase family 6 protein [unclassified Streptomyces]MYQ40973.1 glycoside hydrolase [Streptomyces sp. SID4921]SCK06875.1 endoglucanase [Streptomyces sp. LamerLS-316]